MKVLIDNDFLVNLSCLERFDIYQLLHNIFEQVNISARIKEEYERKVHLEPFRRRVLDRLKPNRGFWSLCTRIDAVTLSMYESVQGIDYGEAEILSQAEKIGVPLIITDDQKFINAAKNIGINLRFRSTLFVMALLDLNGLLSDSYTYFAHLYNSRKFKRTELVEAYELAYTELSLAHNKKVISAKTSLKTITTLAAEI
jgi:predicted nucleic acid-binding protein